MKTKKEKVRKILQLLPFVIIPIAAGIFWIVKNGRNNFTNTGSDSTQTAFNEKLPGPNVSDKEKTKLEIYMEAKKDSLDKQEKLNQDERQKRYYDPAPTEQPAIAIKPKSSLYNGNGYTDPNEQRVNEHLQK